MRPLHETDVPIVNHLSRYLKYYPGILEWYAGLKDDFSTGRRSKIVLRKGNSIRGIAIMKNGPKAKLCHISISPEARARRLGWALMNSAITNMASRGAREIHVTTSEEVFRDHGKFFRYSGFKLIDWELHKYRKGTSELIWQMKIEPESRRYVPGISKDIKETYDCYRYASIASLSTRLRIFDRYLDSWLANRPTTESESSVYKLSRLNDFHALCSWLLGFRGISTRGEVAVLGRNGSTCLVCGLTPEDINPFTRSKVRPYIGHLVDESHGCKDELLNLVTLCSICNDAVRHITAETPRKLWSLSQIRQAGRDEQDSVLEWLRKKFA